MNICYLPVKEHVCPQEEKEQQFALADFHVDIGFEVIVLLFGPYVAIIQVLAQLSGLLFFAFASYLLCPSTLVCKGLGSKRPYWVFASWFAVDPSTVVCCSVAKWCPALGDLKRP